MEGVKVVGKLNPQLLGETIARIFSEQYGVKVECLGYTIVDEEEEETCEGKA